MAINNLKSREDCELVIRLRRHGFGYRKIAELMGFGKATVKLICRGQHPNHEGMK